jgi:hypothetical protein
MEMRTSGREEAVRQALLGLPIGIAFGTVAMLLASLSVGDGALHAVTPTLLGRIPNELAAFSLQTLLCALYGVLCMAANHIFKLSTWSLARQTLTHFLLIAPAIVAIAVFCGWIPFSPLALALYLLFFVALYAIIWLSIWLYWRNEVNKLNARLGRFN